MNQNTLLLNYEDIILTYKSRGAGIRALDKYKQWFPIMPSVRLAGVVADLMWDGHLQDFPKLRIDYTSNLEEELKRFDREVFSLFSIHGKIRDCKTNKYNTKNLGINNKPLVHFDIKTTNPFLEGKIYLRKDGKKTRGIRLKIKNMDSLKKFYYNIGFEKKIKMQKLYLIIK